MVGEEPRRPGRDAPPARVREQPVADLDDPALRVEVVEGGASEDVSAARRRPRRAAAAVRWRRGRAGAAACPGAPAGRGPAGCRPPGSPGLRMPARARRRRPRGSDGRRSRGREVRPPGRRAEASARAFPVSPSAERGAAECRRSRWSRCCSSEPPFLDCGRRLAAVGSAGRACCHPSRPLLAPCGAFG